MKIEELKKLLKEFDPNITFYADLKKKIGLILGVKQRFFLKPMN